MAITLAEFLEANKDEINQFNVVMAHRSQNRGYSVVLKKNMAFWKQRGWQVVHDGPAVTAPKGVKRGRKGSEESEESGVEQ